VADTGGRPGCSDRHASLTLPRRPDAYPAGVDQASPRGSETVRLQPTTGFGRVLSPRDLWRYRDLALQIAVRDITVRYRQTALGAAWAVLQPIGFMIVFTLIFGKLAGISSEGLPYALFSLAALVPWTYFATAVQLGSDSLVSNSQLVAKIYFPRIFIPSAVVVAGLVDIAIAFAILLVVVAAVITHMQHMLLGPAQETSEAHTSTTTAVPLVGGLLLLAVIGVSIWPIERLLNAAASVVAR
jgi:ABC-type polysaccharide/polyol phosphate export permease